VGIRHITEANVRIALTDRHDGTSAPPYAELNLSCQVGDDPSTVQANRDWVAKQLGLDPRCVVYMKQVHGNAIVVVRGPRQQPVRGVDGLVTNVPGLALAVLAADCLPVLLADSAAGVIGVAHAGRGGLLAGVAPAVVTRMLSLGARADRIRVVLGPVACGRCYEVPLTTRESVAAIVPAARAVTRQATPSLDIAAGVVSQLERSGVSLTEWPPCCTMESDAYFSYRRDGPRTGRCAGYVWID